MCKLQSPSLSVYTVMTEADRHHLNCVAEVPLLVHKWTAEKVTPGPFPTSISPYFFEKITSNFKT